jgi:hypothetical protein
MKAGVLLLFSFALVVGMVLPAAGQITITSADASAMFSLGKTSWNYEDTTTTSLNIGGAGSSSWDFRSLHADFAASLTSVAPASTPYTADFPAATHAFQTAESMEGIVMTVYQYFTLSTNSLLNPGTMGGGTSQFGTVVYSLKNNPAAMDYAFPSTYGSTWNTSYAETYQITVGGYPIVGPTVTNYSDSYSVDAYGPMTIPGGATYQALRIRLEERSPELKVSYIFIANEGAIITVSALDTTYSSGEVQIASVTWISPTAVGVAAEKTTPTEYALSQNFPNPFNPATVIRYQVPVTSSVRLSVYDLIGREVAVLINETKAPGEYTAKFDAKGLSSGVYLYRLEAGNFAQTRRMLLVK